MDSYCFKRIRARFIKRGGKKHQPETFGIVLELRELLFSQFLFLSVLSIGLAERPFVHVRHLAHFF